MNKYAADQSDLISTWPHTFVNSDLPIFGIARRRGLVAIRTDRTAWNCDYGGFDKPKETSSNILNGRPVKSTYTFRVGSIYFFFFCLDSEPIKRNACFLFLSVYANCRPENWLRSNISHENRFLLVIRIQSEGVKTVIWSCRIDWGVSFPRYQ